MSASFYDALVTLGIRGGLLEGYGKQYYCSSFLIQFSISFSHILYLAYVASKTHVIACAGQSCERSSMLLYWYYTECTVTRIWWFTAFLQYQYPCFHGKVCWVEVILSSHCPFLPFLCAKCEETCSNQSTAWFRRLHSISAALDRNDKSCIQQLQQERSTMAICQTLRHSETFGDAFWRYGGIPWTCDQQELPCRFKHVWSFSATETIRMRVWSLRILYIYIFTYTHIA